MVSSSTANGGNASAQQKTGRSGQVYSYPCSAFWPHHAPFRGHSDGSCQQWVREWWHQEAQHLRSWTSPCCARAKVRGPPAQQGDGEQWSGMHGLPGRGRNVGKRQERPTGEGGNKKEEGRQTPNLDLCCTWKSPLSQRAIDPGDCPPACQIRHCSRRKNGWSFGI